jgi:hypothetical protein
MNRQTVEREPSVDEMVAQEQKVLHEMQLIRDKEMEGLSDRVLQFEESGAIRIISYNDYEKETLVRDALGVEQVEVEEISLDEKSELDSMYETISDYELFESDTVYDIDDDRELDEGFFRDDVGENERDDLEYDD